MTASVVHWIRGLYLLFLLFVILGPSQAAYLFARSGLRGTVGFLFALFFGGW